MVLPSPAEILKFLADTPAAAGKREIARAFGLHGEEKVALKALIGRMLDEGALGGAAGRVHAGDGLPRVTVLRVIDIAGDGAAFAVPDRWEKAGPPPRVRVIEAGRRGAMGLGDRLLARIEAVGEGYRAHPMKRLEARAELVLGVLRRSGAGWWLAPVDKKSRLELAIDDPGEADAGELVLVAPTGRGALMRERVVERLGDPFAPGSFSLIAIAAKGIPVAFPDGALEEADAAAAAPLGPREDLRALPFVTIDPADARDHDDAVWAEADPAGGWRAIVAIADVSWFVRPGTALDRAARERGNSVYFPDRVVPMLPEALSADACSLVAGRDRGVLACHLSIGPRGAVRSARFTRAVIRCVENVAYEDAQARVDAGAGGGLKALWGAWAALAAARARREPLELDLPERRVVLGADGRIAAIETRERLDAHRLIEEFMITANVAAAVALEGKRVPVMYRCHEEPGREKLVALKDYLETFGIAFTLGQVMKPAVFNRVLEQVKGTDHADQVSEQVLRTQTQAYYAPRNTGHFGLGLASYGHFTSPIRRYSDLVVHRALVRAFALGDGGLSDDEAAAMPRTGEHISQTERRAMEAERDTTDRYVAAFLGDRVGEIVEAKITGVARFGFFAGVLGVGGDGLVPVSTLGDERFEYDEARRVLEGTETGTRYHVGQRLQLRLAEANPVSGALRFEPPAGASAGPSRAGRGGGDRRRGGGRPRR